jgi:hypothetical protein
MSFSEADASGAISDVVYEFVVKLDLGNSPK